MLTRKQILERVWDEATVDSSALDVRVARLLQPVRGAGDMSRKRVS